MNIEQRKDVRFHFLSLLYKLTGGKEFKFLEYKVVGAQLGLDEKSAFRVAQYLAEEGLLRFRASTGLLTITHGGITEVEESHSIRDEDSSHFAPSKASSVKQANEKQMHIGGTKAASDSGFSAAQTMELREIIGLVRTSMGRLNLERQESEDMDADIRTIEAQLSSSRPKRIILVEALESMRGILEGATGGAPMPVLIGKMVALSASARTIEA